MLLGQKVAVYFEAYTEYTNIYTQRVWTKCKILVLEFTVHILTTRLQRVTLFHVKFTVTCQAPEVNDGWDQPASYHKRVVSFGRVRKNVML